MAPTIDGKPRAQHPASVGARYPAFSRQLAGFEFDACLAILKEAGFDRPERRAPPA